LAPRIEAAIADVTPGVVLRAFSGGALVCDLQVGDTRRFYDLASLTKIVFTQQALVQAFDAGLWTQGTTVGDVLPDFTHPQTRLTELLTHTSGIEWWMPFYESVDMDMSWMDRRRWLYAQLQGAPCNKTGRAVYSDLGFMLLGFVLEAMHRKNLLQVWQDLKARTYPGSSLDFHVDNHPACPADQYAATELCPWRHKRLQGEVHDDNTWSLGGLSTHAGLFGSIDDLAAYGLQLRAQLLGLPGALVQHATALQFSRRAIAVEAGDWALGFMLPSPHGASCGRYFSPRSIGHTGFTGTSLWFDPERDLLVAILSNRVYGGRENKAFLALRPQLHDWVVESL
jgi:CubicO group peptidase (beta-lactamase class C family)